MVSKGGKVAIAFVVILLVAAALIGWYCWKKQRTSRSADNMSKDESTASPAHDTDDEYEEDIEMFGFENLGAAHCGSDVHVCHSASCGACNPVSMYSDGAVCFIKAKNGTKKVVEDIEEAKEEGVEQELDESIEEQDMEERLTKKKKRKVSFASLFARRGELIAEEPSVPTREVTVSVVLSNDMGEPESVEVEP